MINNTKTEEDLMNLKGFSSRPKVHGSICNLWFSCLRNRYPWEYLLFSQDNNNQDYYKNQIKAKIVGSFYKKIELIVSGTLTQESVDELNSILKELKNLRKPNLPDK